MGDAAPDDLVSSTRPGTTSMHDGTSRSNARANQARSNGMNRADGNGRSQDRQALRNAGPSPIDHTNDSDDDVQYRSADEEETKLVPNEPSKPRKITQKKTIEQANFSQWLNTNRASLSTKPSKHSASQQEETIRYLVKSSEGGQKIIDIPRDYQLELFERAKTENTIAVLDTGSGKTLIAVLLLRHIISQELEDRKNGLRRRLSFFLVEKVALAFQQHAVLECNLPQSCAVFSGESTKYEWSKDFWDRELAKHEVIVCTAEILRTLLHHALITIDRINLLIFDEAHHTKKNHPYARIIKDFYVEGKKIGLRVPRIFGMTASPVDALHIDVRKAAMELEGLLDGRIATTAIPNALKTAVSTPKKEIIASYSPLGRALDSPLTAQLKPLVSGNTIFSRQFSFAETASRELGPWFVDRMWTLVLDDEAQGLKLEAKTERDFMKEMASEKVVNGRKHDVRTARSLIEAYKLVQPEKIHLSSKVQLLVDLLQKHFQDPSIRCIVFVEKRWTAKLMADYFGNYNTAIPELKVGFLMGANKLDGSSETSFRGQLKTLYNFKKGSINCIFATSVAEEGLDITDCNLIIRFDICRTMIQYIQSRGRARQAESTYIHIIEEGNKEHERTIYQNSQNEVLLRNFCTALPKDRLLEGSGSEFDIDYFLQKEKALPTQMIKATGAKLNYYNSLSILQDFVNSLRNQDDFVEGMPLVADYSTSSVQGGFLCEIFMPAASPISNAIGKVHPTKQVAKCSAAFEACRRLIKGKYLDDHLRSRFAEKRRHIFASAHLAVSSKKRQQYGMHLKPLLWAELGKPKMLWATLLTLTQPERLGRPSRPLLILTRTQLPQIKPFPLFFGSAESGMMSDMVPIGLNIPIIPAEEDQQLFANYTLRTFTDIFAKRYEVSTEEMCYFFLPAKAAHSFPFSAQSDPREVIDWELLRRVMDVDAEVYTGDEPDEFFQDKYVVDPYDGGRRLWLRGVRRDLKCRDPVPADVKVEPNCKEWKKNTVPHDILNWSVAAWKKTRERRQDFLDENQPVVEGVLASFRRDFLADLKEDRKDKVCYFALKPMRISPLAADAVAMAYLLPSIVHRIEQNLIALDACKLLQLDIHPDLALEALTQDSENQADDDGGALEQFEPVNFQPGMGNNYERLEFLGDSFLKMSTTIAIFTEIPNKDEFDYHCERMVMICNKNLFNVALELKLQEYIRSKSLERGTWYPNWKLVAGKAHLKTLKEMDAHNLADKSIADVCEALIGAAYMTTRSKQDFTMAIQAVTKLVNNRRHTMMSWEDYYAAYRIPDWQTVPPNATEVDMAQRMTEITGYTFKYPRVLRSAFRHPSRPYIFDKVPTYQRMEFLGDALLDMACVDYLFHIAPDKGPQWLTEHKMAMVSNQFLGCLAVTLGIHRFLMHNHPTIGAQVMEYATELNEARHAAEDQAEASGLRRSEYAKDYWVEVAQPPKCIPDVLEAYLGAVFVDSGYDYSEIQSFFARHMVPYFTDMRIYDTFANKHPVTFLTHFVFEKFGCHAYGLHSQEVEVTDEQDIGTGRVVVVAAILIHGQVVEGARRESGRYAKVAAAQKSMTSLKSMTKEEFITEYGCDCKPGEAAEDINEIATPI